MARRKIDAKALAKTLMEKQLLMFERDFRANPNTHKLAPSELSWLLDVYKTMAEEQSKAGSEQLKTVSQKDLLSVVNGEDE